MNNRTTFRQSDITRAMRGVAAGGLAIGRVEIARDGTIIITPAGSPLLDPANPWDELGTNHGKALAAR